MTVRSLTVAVLLTAGGMVGCNSVCLDCGGFGLPVLLVYGTVRTDSGAPVSNLDLAVRLPAPLPAGCFGDAVGQAYSDAQGRYRLWVESTRQSGHRPCFVLMGRRLPTGVYVSLDSLDVAPDTLGADSVRRDIVIASVPQQP